MRTKDRSIGYAWRLDSRFLLRLVRLLACAAWCGWGGRRRWLQRSTHARVFVWSAWRAAKNVKGEKIFQSPFLYPQFSHDRLSPPIGGGEPAVSRPSVAPSISVIVFGTTWGYFYSRLPAFPSLTFFHFVRR